MTWVRPVLARVWLEKNQKRSGCVKITSQLTRYSRKRLIAASEHSKNLQKADKSTFRHSDINKNKEAHPNERKPSSRQAQNFPTATKFERLKHPAHLTKACRSQNPNQLRLLSTSCISSHNNMSKATWQLNATFTTSQS